MTSRITSVQNPRIKVARSLHRPRGRAQTGNCLLEGLRLVRDAWQSGVMPQPLFYVPDAAEQDPAVAALVAEIGDGRGEVIACTPSVFAALSDTAHPQGIAAVVPQPRLPLPEAPRLTLLLDGVQDPGNAGTLLRTAEAAGADLVILGPGTVDALNSKVLRAAMGAHFRLPVRQQARWQEVWPLLPDGPVYVADVTGDLAYDEADWTAPLTLVLGNEANGPGPEVRAAGRGIHIPMLGRVESLNVAVSGAVLLFEAARQRRRRSRAAARAGFG